MQFSFPHLTLKNQMSFLGGIAKLIRFAFIGALLFAGLACVLAGWAVSVIAANIHRILPFVKIFAIILLGLLVIDVLRWLLRRF